jgi:hypothetical protein
MVDLFFKGPTYFGRPQLLHFFTQFGVSEGLLVARLMHYQKSFKFKTIK